MWAPSRSRSALHGGRNRGPLHVLSRLPVDSGLDDERHVSGRLRVELGAVCGLRAHRDLHEQRRLGRVGHQRRPGRVPVYDERLSSHLKSVLLHK